MISHYTVSRFCEVTQTNATKPGNDRESLLYAARELSVNELDGTGSSRSQGDEKKKRTLHIESRGSLLCSQKPIMRPTNPFSSSNLSQFALGNLIENNPPKHRQTSHHIC
jgi:hypothetical protein